MYPIDLTGKTALVFGVANHRSIAWEIAKILDDAGAQIILSYQNEKVQNCHYSMILRILPPKKKLRILPKLRIYRKCNSF